MLHDYQPWSEEPQMQAEDDDDFLAVKGHQRSNVVNYVFHVWLPYLVKQTADVS